MRPFNTIPIKKIVPFFSVFLFFSSALPASPPNVFALTSLTLTEPANIRRVAEPVTTGIPFPKSANILSVHDLTLSNAGGRRMPAQFTVLSRWNGRPHETEKPVKWALADFQTNLAPGAVQTLHVKTGAADRASGTRLSIQEDADRFIIHTGKAVFEISKHHFNLFDRVWIDADNDGQMNDPSVSQPGRAGVVLTDKQGKRFTALPEAPEAAEIEEQGPLRSVLKIRGVLKSQDGTYFAPSVHSTEFDQPYPHSFVYYNCRMHFYDNKDFIRVFFTLENNGANGRTNPEPYFAPVQAVYFDSVSLVLETDFGDSRAVRSEGVSVKLNGQDTFSLYQDWHENLEDDAKDTLEPRFTDGIYYKTRKNQSLLSEGRTHPGWLDVYSGNIGFGFAMRHFWQNFPKKLTVSPGKITIGLWPEEGYYPYCASENFPNAKHDAYCREAGKSGGAYLFDAGRHKTYEMVFRFHRGDDPAGTRHLSRSVEYPLMALAPSEWYAETAALGMIGPAGLSSPDPESNEALKRFEKHHRAMVDEKESENGRTFLNLKTVEPPYWEYAKQNRFFNWMNFGDLLWSGQLPSALHYDWPYSMLLHYLRTGRRAFFDAGVEMAKHRYDIDQYHGERTGRSSKWISHTAFYESSGHADPVLHSGHPSKVSPLSHTWNGGLLLYYLITGDRKALEAAEENGLAALNHYGPGGLFDADIQRPARHETRMETWSILNLVNLYRVTGDGEYLRVAKNIAKNRILVREQAAGGRGNFGKGDDDDIRGDRQSTVMWQYAVEAMVNIHYETQNPELKKLLIRMADFTKDHFLFGGKFNDKGEYMPLQSCWSWHEEDPDGTAGLASLDPDDPGYYRLKRNYSGSPVNTFFWTDLFAYVYQLTNEGEYLKWARNCFKDAVFYYDKSGKTVGKDGFLAPPTRARLSFIDGRFPESRTKIHGWACRSSQVYLFTEWRLQQKNRKTSFP